MNKYEVLKTALDKGDEASMKCRGNSMLPILTNPSTCRYRREPFYKIGDIVFCKVRGNYIDAHKITAIRDGKYLISNNHGHDNGWTSAIFGRVISAISASGREKFFGEQEPRVAAEAVAQP
jgi:hypothetical protein|nr:hypothetical protein [Neorhizobium tomejilense]